ncbi:MULTISPECIES: hypothetical protein [Actinoplanes]|uniref:mechanosensitive ion channel family protein n=1 Tax=Actinoplanes TaxID=1865 RepID=UPI0005F2E9E2|nr:MULTISPECIES: hypothetical protein [Actinoplanes]GLY06147.1 hypothetical protein Acsp01_65260 [Actinoplanes sp. NBRC 101535]
MTGDGLSRGLSDMWRSVVLFLPYAVAFALILLVGWLLAWLARTLTVKALRRAGFDRAVERGIAGRLLKDRTAAATDFCGRLVFWAVMLIALQLAFGLWGPNPVSDLLTGLISWLPQLFVAVVVLVVAAAIAGAAHDLIRTVLGVGGTARLLARVAAGVIVTLGVIAALDQVGIATAVTRPLLITVLATVAGVIIVGVGGGLVRPMQQRWEGWLERAATESAAIREQARARAEERARAAAEEEARRAEEMRLAEEARRAEEARIVEEARLAEESRLAEEARRVEEARLAEEETRAVEVARLAEARAAEEAHRAEEARIAENRRAEEARRAERERAEAEARERSADETQVITTDAIAPAPAGPTVFTPGVRPESRTAQGPEDTTTGDAGSATTRETENAVITQGPGSGETTVITDPEPDASVNVEDTDEGDRTQVVPLPDTDETETLPLPRDKPRPR